jgi:hypothetical protein
MIDQETNSYQRKKIISHFQIHRVQFLFCLGSFYELAWVASPSANCEGREALTCCRFSPNVHFNRLPIATCLKGVYLVWFYVDYLQSLSIL